MSIHSAAKKMQFKLVLAVAAATAAMLGAREARAALIVDYQNGSIVVADNGPTDSDPTVGRIINTTTVAGFGIAITVAASNSPGSATGGLLQIQSLDVQNGNPEASTLIIRVRDTGFTTPGGAGSSIRMDSAVGGTFTNAPVGNNLTFQSFADPNNVDPAAAVNTAALVFTKSTNLATESFSGANFTNFNRNAGPYSLMNKTTMQLAPGAQMNMSGTTATSLVPEPASLALLAAGVLGMRRRRR